MVIEAINGFITTAFNFIVSFLTPILETIKSMSGNFYILLIVILSAVLSYFLSKWERFTKLISGDIGLTIMLSVLLSLILLLIGGGI